MCCPRSTTTFGSSDSFWQLSPKRFKSHEGYRRKKITFICLTGGILTTENVMWNQSQYLTKPEPKRSAQKTRFVTNKKETKKVNEFVAQETRQVKEVMACSPRVQTQESIHLCFCRCLRLLLSRSSVFLFEPSFPLSSPRIHERTPSNNSNKELNNGDRNEHILSFRFNTERLFHIQVSVGKQVLLKALKVQESWHSSQHNVHDNVHDSFPSVVQVRNFSFSLREKRVAEEELTRMLKCKKKSA